MTENVTRKVKVPKVTTHILEEVSRKPAGKGWDDVEYKWKKKPVYKERTK